MKLTKAAHPNELKRFGHLRSAGLFSPHCDAKFPDDVYTCTLRPNHDGPHAAHTFLGTLVAVWTAPGNPPSPAARVERMVQFGELTDADLEEFATWCGDVVLGFEGDANGDAMAQFFMPLSSTAINLLQVRLKETGRTATHMLDRSMVSGLDDELLGFTEALLRGQRDTYIAAGRSAKADLLSTIMTFLQAERAARDT